MTKIIPMCTTYLMLDYLLLPKFYCFSILIITLLMFYAVITSSFPSGYSVLNFYYLDTYVRSSTSVIITKIVVVD